MKAWKVHKDLPPLIFILGTTRTLVFSYTLRPLYHEKEWRYPLNFGHRAGLDVSVHCFNQKTCQLKTILSRPNEVHHTMLYFFKYVLILSSIYT
jgi:hypothetical protein